MERPHRNPPKQPAQSAPTCRGFSHSYAERSFLVGGRGRAYRLPILVLLDTLRLSPDHLQTKLHPSRTNPRAGDGAERGTLRVRVGAAELRMVQRVKGLPPELRID